MKCFSNSADNATEICPIVTDNFEAWLAQQDERVKTWVSTQGFKAESGYSCLLPNTQGELEQVLLGVESLEDTWAYGALPAKLMTGTYCIKANLSAEQQQLAALAWGLGCYQFTVYKKAPAIEAQLVLPAKCDQSLLENTIYSTYLVRNLINMPTEDMGPAELAEATVKLADEFSAEVHQIVGDELLKQNYPTIHAVGRASVNAPRLIDLRWGDESHPKLTLVGKGVCFDTGGLNVKTLAGMLDMKKDMGGAAHALGLARMIMAAKLPVRLRVLVVAVENVIAGDSYKPGDVIVTRQGITVEVNNTDAEGRLILSDALAEASTEKPDLLVDFATLTGAARVALGSEVSALFTEQDELAELILECAEGQRDPICRLPLYKPYRSLLNSKIADISNVSETRYGGAITAALFLKEFVADGLNWLHFDIMAANIEDKPGRPTGGEAVAIRALFNCLQKKFK